MNPPRKNPAKTRQDLADLLRMCEEPEHNATTKLPNGATITWYHKKGTPMPKIERGTLEWKQFFNAPEHWYGLHLWPWYLRGPFSAWLRNWYARRHPEIFGSDYK